MTEAYAGGNAFSVRSLRVDQTRELVGSLATGGGFQPSIRKTVEANCRFRRTIDGYWPAMILIGAPRIVSGSDTTAPTPLTAVCPHVASLMVSRYPPGEHAAQFGPDRRELGEFVVVRRVGRLDVRKVDDRRAQRGKLRNIRIVANPRDAPRNGPGQKQRSIVRREDDVEGLRGLPKRRICDLNTSMSMSGAAR